MSSEKELRSEQRKRLYILMAAIEFEQERESLLNFVKVEMDKEDIAVVEEQIKQLRLAKYS